MGLDAGNRRARIKIQGIVQGVGFRPFIFQLASEYGLGGWVRNQSDGVEIDIAGPAERLDAFIDAIPAKAPPLARIVRLDVSEQVFSPPDPFCIVKSLSAQARSTLIAPDVCTCPDCHRELLDPQDRRYRYPFINCTNCGPRYTIIQDIPYDRHKTTMASFVMCPACLAEYEDPLNRRFHAQPNACWDCGPQVWLEAANGQRMAERDEAVRQAGQRLTEGAILAVKGLGGFHLAVTAFQEASVARLRSRKIREEKPFAVMFSCVEAVKRVCEVSREEEALLASPQRPILLLKKRKDAPSGTWSIAPAVAPRNGFLGAFLPYTPLHFLLFQDTSCEALVMTSGNQSDEPIVTHNEEASERLKGIADFTLFHDRAVTMRCDDSVTRMLGGKPRPLRRARGYVPVPVFLGRAEPSVLGVGAELKSTVCLTRGNEAFVSQHIGDLENLETLHSFERVIEHLQRILEIRPECIVHDLHPDYLSTQWALRQNDLPRFAVQHHHAHIAAVMAERKLDGPILGLALDGTGYGPDGTVWGGEILRVEGEQFERLGHFRPIGLPGGNMAVKEPWRMAVSCLWSLDPAGLESTFGDILSRWEKDKITIIVQMLRRGFNAPLTSSCGRVFDAASALAGLRDSVSYEGQAAVEFEQALDPHEGGAYQGELRKEHSLWIIDPLPIVAEIVSDVRRKCSPGLISARFHNGLVHLLGKAVTCAAEDTGLKRIALSGGVFQNAVLLEKLEAELTRRGLQVHSHLEIPCNDACIALGQAHIGARLISMMRSERRACEVP